MNNKKMLTVLHIAIPIVIMVILAYVAFVSSDDVFAKGLLITSLFAYYPILFLLQGIAASLLKANIFISLGISAAAFIIILLIWMNSSALIYTVLYLIVGFIGYAITSFIQKLIKSKKV